MSTAEKTDAHESLSIVGYSSRLSVAPGEHVDFMVSCVEPEYEVELVRLARAESGYVAMPSEANGRYPGKVQEIRRGSYIAFDRPIQLPRAFRMALWIFPTNPRVGEQGLMTWGGASGVFVTADGDVALRVGGCEVRSGAPLRRGEWYHVTASGDGAEGRLAVVPRRWGDSISASGPLAAEPSANEFRIGEGFDGKIDGPLIEGVAAWDFSLDICSLKVRDTGPNALHGRTVNMPMRGVTGWNWTGREVDFRRAPEEYGAIHFHSDDLADAQWEVGFGLDVPAGLQSGPYAMRVRAGDAVDHLPFFVRPAPGRPTSRVAFLLSTFSYLAYSCFTTRFRGSPPEEREYLKTTLSPGDHYCVDHGLISAYNLHTDGTGNCFVSRLRPMPTLRPDYNYLAAPIGGPHGLSADLHVMDWLDAQEMGWDLITDEDLHHDGVQLLSDYRVVVGGTHPEYWSGAMLDATEAFLESGGRFMYLGGNGMYWVTSVHPDAPHILEIRRTQAGTRAWTSEPGECHQSSTGEPSGIWRHRGRAPQRLFLVGSTGAGHDYGRPYRRDAASYEPEHAWVFEGVDADEFGDYGACKDAAGGFEMDRLDDWLGTPPHAVRLAVSDGFSARYFGVTEETGMHDGLAAGPDNPAVRCDLSYAMHPNGAAVFATGSICWGTSLMCDDGDNDVSRITANVLRRFASE